MAWLLRVAALVTILSHSTAAEEPPDELVLFYDNVSMANMDPRLQVRLNPPSKGPLVISPTEPWEQWAVFGYNSVLRTPSGQARLYYDCIEGSGVPPGLQGRDSLEGGLSHRRVCLAVSEDGITWTKPLLGVYSRVDPQTNRSSTANNILVEDSGVSVFIDYSPGVPAAERWKMICSTSAYTSPDGITWAKMATHPTTSDMDDTKPTAFYDPKLKKYVVYVRRDLAGFNRAIGRCVTSDLSNWTKEEPGQHCPAVYQCDDKDPGALLDLYTNAYTPYPSIEKPAVHLFFPSMYYHFQGNPYGHSNDGLLDVRMLVSRDGISLDYVSGAWNARSPYVSLGDNSCGEGLASRPQVHGGWCDEKSGELAFTSTDSSAMYMASGHLFSNDGSQVFQYVSAQSFTHGADSNSQSWGANTGIRLLTTRRDGFTYVEAPYLMRTNVTALPSLTTMPVAMPLGCSKGVVVRINMQTGVAGFVAAEVQDTNGTALRGYELGACDAVKGSNLGAIPTWSQGRLVTLPPNLTGNVLLKLALTDAKLFSVRLSCSSGATLGRRRKGSMSEYII